MADCQPLKPISGARRYSSVVEAEPARDIGECESKEEPTRFGVTTYSTLVQV